MGEDVPLDHVGHQGRTIHELMAAEGPGLVPLRPRLPGLGRELAQRMIVEARRIGYKQLRLDTVEPMMRAAVAMYRNLGFREIGAYRPNPIEGALYMELEL